MNTHTRRTLTITIIETWTLTWADGAEQPVVYHARHLGHMVPANPNAPRGWTEPKPSATHSRRWTPLAHTDAIEPVDTPG